MKIVRVVVLISVAFFVGMCTGQVSAAPFYQTPTPPASVDSTYDTQCWGRNLYHDDEVICVFDMLNTTVDYSWRLQTMDFDNNVIETVYSTTKTASVATAAAMIFGGDSGFEGSLPTYYAGPLRIIDNFGIVKWQGFMMPQPIVSWGDDTPWTLAVEKQALGTNDRFGPAYIGVQFAGWHNDKTPLGQTTPQGSFGVMHYQVDLAALPVTDEIWLYRAETGSAIGRFSLQQIVDYNHDPEFIGSYTDRETNSYIIFNTDGSDLPFIDKGLSDAELGGGGTYDNPHVLSTGNGAFNCQRRTAAGAAFISDCDSLWLVSNGSVNGQEFDVQVTNETLGVGQNQRVEFTMLTPEIYNAYTGSWNLVDTAVGTVDSNTYAYSLKRRSDAFAVAGSPVNACVVQTYTPFALPAASELTVFDTQQTFFDCYQIVEGLASQDRLREFLAVWGLDTDLGQTIALVLALLGGIAMVKPFGGGLALQSIIYIAVGAVFVLGGVATFLISFVWGISVIYLIYYLWQNMRSGDSNERLA